MQVKYALVEFREPENAVKALRMPNATLAGNRLVIKPRTLSSQKIVPKSPRENSTSSGASRKTKPQPVDVSMHVDVSGVLQTPEVSRKCLLEVVHDLVFMTTASGSAVEVV